MEPVTSHRATVEDEADEATGGEDSAWRSMRTSSPATGLLTQQGLDDDMRSVRSFSDWAGFEDDKLWMLGGDDGIVESDDEIYVDADVDDDNQDVKLPTDDSDFTHKFWKDIWTSRAAQPMVPSRSGPPTHENEQANVIEPALRASDAAKDESIQPDIQASEEQPLGGFAGPSQLILWREKESQIADDVLKKMGIKLRAGRKRKWRAFDQEAREVGRVDGKKIRPRMNTLTDSAATVQGREDEMISG